MGVDPTLLGSEWLRTDDLGRFRVADLPPGDYRVALLRLVEFPIDPVLVTLPVDEDRLDLELRVENDRELTVRCVDDARQPIAGVT